ncbi:MAG: hypothetical protein BWK73_47070 [Thiothrix lacustris]|uniref:Uncharacterized protein n=1 Tax=Thiothrix lacustris TaxID=525917 RepID=A0A1Y1QA18_9GAMM|nr:MAG: hypothetical protein BWK73_47070 [Thiothrix lacustris]
MFGASYWNDGLDASQWVALGGSVLSALVTVAAVGIAAYLAHNYAVRQGKLTHNTAIRADRLRREIKALEDVWALLAYMSDKKSDKAIIHWQKNRSTGGETLYFFHFKNLEQFCLHEVSEVFYQRHAGLFISNEVRDLLYGYRTLAITFYFAHKNDSAIPENSLIRINKPEQAEKLKKIYDDLNPSLYTQISPPPTH